MQRPIVKVVMCLCFFGPLSISQAQSDQTARTPSQTNTDVALLAEIRNADAQIVTDFNAGKAEEIAKLFVPNGEWIDENGVVYQGRESIQNVLTAYFKNFPGAKMSLEVEDVRVLGPLVIEEGVRTMTAGDGDAQAVIHYVAILAKTDDGWKFASVHDTSHEAPLSAHQALESLSWLIGEWVNQNPNGRVQISYRWSEDKSYLLGEYLIQAGDEVRMKSIHRIGWDPLHGRIRSWMFDSDGGFGEGVWTQVDDHWLVHSTAILPDGQHGSATITFTPGQGDRFFVHATDRILGDVPEDDIELTVVRKAPAAGTQKDQQDQ